VPRSITIAFVASALWLAAFAAQAAGLGRLTVLSPLGQPLLAEVEIVALQPGEEDGLSARLASADAFAAAGIEISPALLGVRVDIARRNNKPILRLTTKDAVNEPFLDLLVELQWPSGRLVREYTFLLDPPQYRSRPTIAAAPPPAPVQPAPQAESQPQAQPEAPAVAVAPAATPAAAEEKPVAAEEKPAAAEEKPAAAEEKPAAIEQAPIPPTPSAEAKEAAKEEPAKAEPAKAEAAPAATHHVKKGETLGAIARANMPPGVTLNQMLIAIFRANKDAFIRGNVNLVRTGKILNIPSGDDIGSLDSDEANRLVKEQNDKFAEYRSSLAAAPAGVEGGPEREAAGAIEPKAAAAPPPAPADQVRLSKAEPGKPGAAASRAARADDAAARERALQEAQSRTADLEKNVADLQKLLDLKNQQLAELEKKAAAKPAAQAPQKMAAAPSAPTPARSAPAQPAPQAQAPAPQPAAQPAKPAAPTPPPAPKKAEAPKPRPKAAPPPPEPGIFDEFLDNPLYLAGLGAVVLLLIGYAVVSWRKKKAAHAKFQDSVLGAATAGGGAAALHESTATTAAASVSQAPGSLAPAGMGTEEVDPIAEADVYMAYGRDAQAEEILKEALQKDASRTAVHAKLLEIYANRKDVKAFEQTALKLKNLTSGSGPDWDKAAALGRSIDPQNSVYGDIAAASAAAAPSPAAAPAPTLDFDLGGASQGGPAAPDIPFDESAKEPTASSVDFELGATQTVKIDQKSPDETVATTRVEKSGGGGLDFNFDLGGTEEP